MRGKRECVGHDWPAVHGLAGRVTATGQQEADVGNGLRK
jgi:hypothetical protein